MMKQWILSMTTVLLLLTASVTAGPGPSNANAQSLDIRIADSKGDYGYPTPFRHYPRGPGYVRMSWVFDTLIWKDQNGYIPALARKWSYDPDRLAFVFELDPKAEWHDGTPLTAHDVVFTVAYFKKHPYHWISVADLDRGEADGDHRVVIYLSRPYAPFLSDIAGTMPILPRHVWETVDDPKGFEDPRSFIGSGPYVFKDFNQARGTYLYEAFDHYYQGRPRADRLIYVRTGKALVSLTTGQVDLANIQPDMAEALRQKGMTIIEDERGWIKKLMINHKKYPFSEKAFRQALAFAVDRREIIEKAHRGMGSVASLGLLSVDHDMYNPETPVYPHDPARARSLVESLGYTPGSDGVYVKDGKPLHLELLASSLTVGGEKTADRDGEIIQKQLEAIGMSVSLYNLEQATTDSRVRNWQFDLAVSGHGGISGDPKTLNEMISGRYGAGSVNSARYDDCEALNRLMDAQMTEMDPERRKAMVFEIQTIYADELPAICLYYPSSMAAFTPKSGVTWYFTPGGLGKGVPIAQNKMALIP